MAKKLAAKDVIVKLIVGAGQASPSPPVGPALGSKGVKSMDFCKVSPIELIERTVFDEEIAFADNRYRNSMPEPLISRLEHQPPPESSSVPIDPFHSKSELLRPHGC